MPSAVFSVAMASSLWCQRNSFSPQALAASPSAADLAASSAGGTAAVSLESSSSRLGAMVRRSQPQSALIWPMLRKEAPMTSVLTPLRL